MASSTFHKTIKPKWCLEYLAGGKCATGGTCGTPSLYHCDYLVEDKKELCRQGALSKAKRPSRFPFTMTEFESLPSCTVFHRPTGGLNHFAFVPSSIPSPSSSAAPLELFRLPKESFVSLFKETRDWIRRRVVEQDCTVELPPNFTFQISSHDFFDDAEVFADEIEARKRVEHRPYIELKFPKGRDGGNDSAEPRGTIPSECFTCAPSLQPAAGPLRVFYKEHTHSAIDLQCRAVLVVLPHQHRRSLADLDDAELVEFAEHAYELFAISQPSEFLLRLNHGKWKNCDHLHLKIWLPFDAFQRFVQDVVGKRAEENKQ